MSNKRYREYDDYNIRKRVKSEEVVNINVIDNLVRQIMSEREEIIKKEIIDTITKYFDDLRKREHNNINHFDEYII